MGPGTKLAHPRTVLATFRCFATLILTAFAIPACDEGTTESNAAPDGGVIEGADGAPQERATDGAPPQVHTVGVMTINLRHDADQWQRRFTLIAEEIVRLEPDFIGFQEVEIWADQLPALEQLIAERGGPDYHAYQHLKTGWWAFSGEGIAILSRYPIEQSDFAAMSEGRLVLWTRVALPGAGYLDVYNTHLHHQGGDEVRLLQAQAVTEWMASHQTGHPTFLTGDMNAGPASQTMAHFAEAGLADSYLTIHGPDTGEAGHTWPIVLGDGAFEQSPRRRIDYVLSQQAEAIDSQVVLRNHDSNGYYPSDHLAVISYFELR